MNKLLLTGLLVLGTTFVAHATTPTKSHTVDQKGLSYQVSSVQLGSGTNHAIGTFTVSGTDAIGVSNTLVSAGDVIVVGLKTVSGTVGALPAIQTVTGDDGFTVKGTASDYSTYSYAILKKY